MDAITNAHANIDPNAVEKGKLVGAARPDEQAETSKPQTKKRRRGAARKSQAKDASPTKNAEPVTKAAKILKLLRGRKGASIVQLEEATGWQAHSVRGFLSGTVKKKLGFNVTSEVGKDGVRRYRVHQDAKTG